MNELDLYSSYQLPAPTHKKSKKPKKHKGRWFIWLVILIFISIIFFVANAFANVLSFSSTSLFGTKNITTKSYNVYSILINTFDDKESAEVLSQELQLVGASGYIAYDLKYEVYASAYFKSEDAQNVLSKVLSSYENAEIKILKINACKLSALQNKEYNTITETALNLFKTTFENLYDLGIKLDTSAITSAECKLQLTNLLSSISEVASQFRDVANSTDDTKYKLTQAKVDQVEELVNDLVGSSLVSTKLSSLLKYNQIACLMLQNELALLLN